MRSAVEAGPSAVADLPSATVYMWLSKIFYGVLYRERQNASTGQMEGRTASRDSLKVSFCFIHLNPGAPIVATVSSTLRWVSRKTVYQILLSSRGNRAPQW